MGMTHRFDLVVIGTGSAASEAAFRCRSAGWKVAVIDSRPFGGTCALRGCDPKKVLVGAAEVIDWARRMQGKGVEADLARIDWPELMRFKRSFTESVPEAKEASFARAGIAMFHGRAQFVGKTAVQVGDDLLEGGHVVIAAGAKPQQFRFPGAEWLTSSDQFLELESLPPRILFVGGGYISFEFAHVAARAGARVTIVEMLPRALVRFDPDLVNQLVERTRGLGIDIRLRTAVRAIEKTSNGFNVRTSVEGEEHVFEADLVVHGAGRVPEIDDLDLVAAGVDHDPQGVKVNEYLQSTSNPTVYAAGDAAASGGPPLTPVAGYEGGIVAANLLEGNHSRPDYRGVPSVVFTIPPLASAGMQEEEAREQGLKFTSNHEDTSNWYSSRRVAEPGSGFKILVEEASGRILGAHLLAHHAEETINLFALAIRKGLTARDLKDMLFAYPTHASDVRYML